MSSSLSQARILEHIWVHDMGMSSRLMTCCACSGLASRSSFRSVVSFVASGMTWSSSLSFLDRVPDSGLLGSVSVLEFCTTSAVRSLVASAVRSLMLDGPGLFSLNWQSGRWLHQQYGRWWHQQCGQFVGAINRDHSLLAKMGFELICSCHSVLSSLSGFLSVHPLKLKKNFLMLSRGGEEMCRVSRQPVSWHRQRGAPSES